MTAVLWLTRDLRLHDHPALCAALAEHDCVIPVFCLDRRLLGGRHASGPRTRFLLECLSDLDRSLQARGSALVLRDGGPEAVLPALAREAGATAVHCSADSGPFARRRAARVRAALATAKVRLVAHPGLHAIDDLAAVTTSAGRPYTVFSPFHRAWERGRRRVVVPPPPPRLPQLPAAIDTGTLPAPPAGPEAEARGAPPGGEGPARARVVEFLDDGVRRYHRTKDLPAVDGTSRLSPYLHFGCISPRELEERLPGGDGAAAFRRQLAWRDFHHHVLRHHPGNARAALRPQFRALRWDNDRRLFDAWREGRSGYPLVDAGMRQLLHEGWMHNRVRLVVASFLTKDLAIDWRWGERWFMQRLVDGDEANNNGNWQWIASVGTDPQPAYRRLYNPTRQLERLDPQGEYVRRHVPELRSLPDDALAEPWRMSPEQQHECGCVIGSDYPQPIVDHLVARRAALARYAEAG
jgi:deoxyribodipyrimidine photo-lyase